MKNLFLPKQIPKSNCLGNIPPRYCLLKQKNKTKMLERELVLGLSQAF